MSITARIRAQRIAVAALIASAIVATFFGVLQVKRHHELVRYSYELSDISEALRDAEAENRDQPGEGQGLLSYVCHAGGLPDPV